MIKREKSIFQYKIFNNHNSPNDIVEKIEEELNRGLTFTLSQGDEKIISIKGKWIGWVQTTLQRNNLSVYMSDTFFSNSYLEQILTSLWANLLDFGEIRFEKFQFSDNLHSILISKISSKQFIHKLIGKNGPYFGLVLKPSFSLSISEKINIAQKFACIGGSFLKEDETYLIEESKIIEESERIQRAINEISNNCFYVPNVTSHIIDNKLLKKLFGVGIRIAMVNYLIAGLPTVSRTIKRNQEMLFWGHRVGYWNIQKSISMKALSLLAIYSGIDAIHIGTPSFNKKSNVNECIDILKSLRQVNPKMIPVFTKCSSQIILPLLNSFGREIIVMACGSIRTNGDIDWKKVEQLIMQAKP